MILLFHNRHDWGRPSWQTLSYRRAWRQIPRPSDARNYAWQPMGWLKFWVGLSINCTPPSPSNYEGKSDPSPTYLIAPRSHPCGMKGSPQPAWLPRHPARSRHQEGKQLGVGIWGGGYNWVIAQRHGAWVGRGWGVRGGGSVWRTPPTSPHPMAHSPCRWQQQVGVLMPSAGTGSATSSVQLGPGWGVQPSQPASTAQGS